LQRIIIKMQIEMEIKVCPSCGKKFFARKNQTYCSHACNQKARRKRNKYKHEQLLEDYKKLKEDYMKLFKIYKDLINNYNDIHKYYGLIDSEEIIEKNRNLMNTYLIYARLKRENKY